METEEVFDCREQVGRVRSKSSNWTRSGLVQLQSAKWVTEIANNTLVKVAPLVCLAFA